MVTKSDQSGKVKRWLVSGLLTVIILTLLSLLGWSNWRLFQRRREVEAELNQLDRKIKALKQEKQTIQASINQEDEQLVEEMARQQLNLKKPGEEVIVIERPQSEQESQSQQKKWWQKWWDKIQFWK